METCCIAQGAQLDALWQLCDDLEEWMGQGAWRRDVPEGEDICIYMADSCFCTAETNNIVKQLSVQFNSVHLLSCVSLWPHEPEHARPPCPSPTPGVYPNSCPLSQWCHPIISCSIIPSPPALNLSQHQESFQMSQLFTSGGQSIRSLSFDISPSNKHPGLISFRMDWLDLFAVQGILKSLLQSHSSKASILWH